MLTLEMRVDPHHQARPPGDEPYRLSEAVLAKGREPKALRGLRRKRKNAQTHRLVPPRERKICQRRRRRFGATTCKITHKAMRLRLHRPRASTQTPSRALHPLRR